MTQAELEKLASENPEVRAALNTVTEALEKVADEGTYFNETVPAQGAEAPAQPGADQVPAPDMAAPPQEGLPGEQPMDPNAMPMEEAAPPSPSDEAAYAAQTFLAPVFEAASQGDPNAQNVIAKAAGEVAKGVAAAAAESMGAAPMEEAPVLPPTPEEQVADQIVPNKNDDQQKEEAEEGSTSPAPAKENNEGPEKISMDLGVVSQLIKMAKEGKL